MGFFSKFFKPSKPVKPKWNDYFNQRLNALGAADPELEDPNDSQFTSTTTTTFERIIPEPEKPKTDTDMLQDVLDSFDG